MVSSPADAAALAAALERLGLPLSVEVDGALAVLVPRDGRAVAFPTDDVRVELVRAARAAGFASVALELPAPDAGPDRA